MGLKVLGVVQPQQNVDSDCDDDACGADKSRNNGMYSKFYISFNFDD